MTTDAPASAKPRAIALPMPLLPPVIKATRPVRSKSGELMAGPAVGLKLPRSRKINLPLKPSAFHGTARNHFHGPSTRKLLLRMAQILLGLAAEHALISAVHRVG